MANPSPTSGRLAFRDALRGIAALSVLAQHGLGRFIPGFNEWSIQGCNLGLFGVTLFLAISGFIIPATLGKGSLQFQNVRPFHYGLEMHLARTIRLISEFEPQVVIVDQMSCLESTGTPLELKAAMMRLIDFLKMKGTTAMYTDLTADGNPTELADPAMSWRVDTCLILRDLELDGERSRCLHIVKSRGMAHSNQVREFTLTNHGIELKETNIGPTGMLTGSRRVPQEAEDRAQQVRRNDKVARQQLDLKNQQDLLVGQIAALRAELSVEESRIETIVSRYQQRDQSRAINEREPGRSRKNGAVKTGRTFIPDSGRNGEES
jgi:circadian clock protein KaiC